ncbi:MAG: hypothetical protein HW394_664 [Acidobacteria bacterium]|nr:hypothetical protein [Acidobacteriota bacterium]
MSAFVHHMRLLLLLTLLLTIPLTLGSLAVPLSARQSAASQPFAVAELFFELNDTDGDLGIHASIDGGTWTSLEVDGPYDRQLLAIVSKGRLRSQGLTQLAFESAEPTFEELDPATFFRRFPEGVYEIEALAQGGGTFQSEVQLSHVLAAPATATVSGLPAAESCDAVDLPEVAAPVVIDWDPVTESHPEIGKAGPVTISRYQFFVQQGDTKLSLDLPSTVTEFEIPTSITAAGGVFKFEVIARSSTGNNTAVESCFRMQ